LLVNWHSLERIPLPKHKNLKFKNDSKSQIKNQDAENVQKCLVSQFSKIEFGKSRFALQDPDNISPIDSYLCHLNPHAKFH